MGHSATVMYRPGNCFVHDVNADGELCKIVYAGVHKPKGSSATWMYMKRRPEGSDVKVERELCEAERE